MCYLYLYSFGHNLLDISKRLDILYNDEKRSNIDTWNWIQILYSCHIYDKRVSAFIVDETVIQIGDRHFWLWFRIESIHKYVLGIYISERKYVCRREFHQVFS